MIIIEQGKEQYGPVSDSSVAVIQRHTSRQYLDKIFALGLLLLLQVQR